MRMRTIEIGVGVFILAGMFALLLLALQVSGLSLKKQSATYPLYAEFDNIGSLTERAKVSIAGVVIGRVAGIELNKKTYMARVKMMIDSDIDNVPIDSIAAIETAGLLGEKYIGISIGGADEFLLPDELFDDTQSAIVLEHLIGKFVMGAVGKEEGVSEDAP